MASALGVWRGKQSWRALGVKLAQFYHAALRRQQQDYNGLIFLTEADLRGHGLTRSCPRLRRRRTAQQLPGVCADLFREMDVLRRGMHVQIEAAKMRGGIIVSATKIVFQPIYRALKKCRCLIDQVLPRLEYHLLAQQ